MIRANINPDPRLLSTPKKRAQNCVTVVYRVQTLNIQRKLIGKCPNQSHERQRVSRLQWFASSENRPAEVRRNGERLAPFQSHNGERPQRLDEEIVAETANPDPGTANATETQICFLHI